MLGKFAAGGSNQNDAASSSQMWLTDAKIRESARKLAAAGTNLGQSFQERTRKFAAENSDINDEDDSEWAQNYRISRVNVPHFEKVLSNLRQKFGRKPEHKIEDFDMSTLIWRMFMIVTQQAAVHFGNDYLDNFCKDNTSTEYSLNWRWQDKVGLQHEEKLGLRLRGETERQDFRHQWQRDNQDQHSAHETRHLTSECARSLLVSSCCRHLHSFAHHFAWLKLSAYLSHLIHAWSERHSSALSSPFDPTSSSLYSLSISRSSCCFSISLRIRRNTVFSANREMGSTDESYSHTGYEPKDDYFMEIYVESLTQSLTQQQYPVQRPFEDVDYDDAALEEMLHNAHREHVYHSHREGLSVGQSSSSVSERTVRPVVERSGRFVVERGQERNTEHAQIGTLLGRQREQIIAECQAEIKKHEFQANYGRRIFKN